MTFTEEQVEWIVVEVIRRLGVAVGREANHGGSQPASPWAAAPPTATQADFALVEKVVTMRSIEGRLHGIRRLIVPPKAVVTPAVCDELRQRQIELVREDRK